MYAKIKELCKKHGTSITELERELEFSRGSICKWDVNVPSIDKVKAVADYLDVTVDELLENDMKEVNNVPSLTSYSKFEELLKESGLRASDVAKATGICQSTFCDWKKGKSSPKIDKIQKLADYFGVPLSYFNDGFEFSLKNVPTEILLEELARRCKANE